MRRYWNIDLKIARGHSKIPERGEARCSEREGTRHIQRIDASVTIEGMFEHVLLERRGHD